MGVPAQQGVRYEGVASRKTCSSSSAPLAVEDLVDVCSAPRCRARRSRRPPSAGDSTLTTRTRWRPGVPLRGRLARLASVEERRDGAEPLRVAFGDYEDGFARALDFTGERGLAARIAYDKVERNATIDPGVFAPPPASRVLPLERAAALRGWRGLPELASRWR